MIMIIIITTAIIIMITIMKIHINQILLRLSLPFFCLIFCSLNVTEYRQMTI